MFCQRVDCQSRTCCPAAEALQDRSAQIRNGNCECVPPTPVTGATITLNQGVTVRTAVIGLNTICN